MKLNADQHFLKGRSHHVCEDYALSQVFEYRSKQYAIAIVSDGCSSSDNTDFGSRILSTEYLNNVKSGMYYFVNNSHDVNPYQIFKANTITSASKIVSLMGLNRHVLDATVISALTDGETIWLNFYGDGVIRITYEDETFVEYSCEFESNAPYYMSYYLDPVRNENYLKEFSRNIVISKSNNSGVYEVLNSTVLDLNQSFIISAEKRIKSISVSSDGIDTFVKDQRNPINMKNKFNEFKNFTGEFVKRRLSAIDRECKVNNINYMDDISLAAIHVDYEGE